jgi:hypothetical protein
MPTLATLLAYFLCATPAPSAVSTSQYTSVNDKKTCAFHEVQASDEGPGSCEYLCEGPAPGVKTKLLSCSDYEHLYFQIGDKVYSTWHAMTEVGGFSGIANKNGVVEWVFKTKGSHKLEELAGLIVRFNGVDQNNKRKEALAVFAIGRDGVCWKGNQPDNEKARAALEQGACQETLRAEPK